MIQTRISRLRDEMKKRNIGIYIIPTADFHESEYVGEYFKARKYITGFPFNFGLTFSNLLIFSFSIIFALAIF